MARVVRSGKTKAKGKGKKEEESWRVGDALYSVHFAAGNKLGGRASQERRTCDWCELSLKLNKDADGAKAGVDAKGKGKAKGDKKVSDDEGKHKGLSGLELHDLYLYKILRGLKAGRVLWTDDD